MDAIMTKNLIENTVTWSVQMLIIETLLNLFRLNELRNTSGSMK